jgi:dUTP pyrophosphatase
MFYLADAPAGILLRMNPRVRIVAEPGATLPEYQTEHASGLDLCAFESGALAPGERAMVRTGIRVEIPPNLEAQVRPRSGLAIKHGITMINAPGTIDADFRGEIKVLLVNLGQEIFNYAPGDRIAQLVFAPVIRINWEQVTDLADSNRGHGGFGSTGGA